MPERPGHLGGLRVGPAVHPEGQGANQAGFPRRRKNAGSGHSLLTRCFLLTHCWPARGWPEATKPPKLSTAQHGPGRILPRRAGGTDAPPRLGLRGRGRPLVGRGGCARACVHGAGTLVASPAWFPQGCAPRPVPTSVEAIGLFTRPLVPAATGHHCQWSCTPSATKGPREEWPSRRTGPRAWSAGPCAQALLPCWPCGLDRLPVVLRASHLCSGDPHAYLGVTCVRTPGAVPAAGRGTGLSSEPATRPAAPGWVGPTGSLWG